MAEREFKVGDYISLQYKDITALSGYYAFTSSSEEINGKIIASLNDKFIILVDDKIECGYKFDALGDAYQDAIQASSHDLGKNPNFFGMYKTDLNRLARLNILNKDSSLTKEKTMSNKLVEVLKGDAKEAAYRVAGTQITNGVKLGVIKLFESKGGKSDQMEMLKSLLDSEMGDSLISLILGYGLNYAPKLKDDPRIQKLSEEFRINGMSVAGNAIMGAAMDSLLPVLSSALQALPEETSSNTRISELSEEEEEEEASPVKAVKTASR